MGTSILLPQKTAEVTSWYFEKDFSSLLSPANDAFTDARDFFSSNLIPPEDRPSTSQWLSTINTMSDFKTTITTLQNVSHSNSLSKASKPRQWLASCAERISFYGSIMDVLVQQHPEYVSLAWGAFKFLFTVDVQAVVNYEKLLKSIAKTFSRIADILPRADLHLRLYSTTYMLSDVAQIYASILLFVRRATEWYAKNRIQRSLSAVIRPFEISFKDIVDNIMACSRRVDERAGAAMKAELRDLHIEIMQMRDSTNANIAQIRSDIHSQTQQFTRHQRSQALSILSRSSDPDPIVNLDFYRSLMRRRKAHVFSYQRRRGSPWPATLTQTLQSWSTSDKSSIVLIKASQFIAPAYDVAVDLIDLLRESKVPGLWMMTPGRDDVQIEPSDIFRTLLVQALSKNEDIFTADVSFPLTPAHMQNAQADQAMWPSILAKAICNFAPQIFIVIAISALQHDGAESGIQNLIAQLERTCALATGTTVKVIVADRYHSQGLQEVGKSSQVTLVSIDPRKDFRRVRAARLQSSHVENRVVSRANLVFTVTASTEDPTDETDDWG